MKHKYRYEPYFENIWRIQKVVYTIEDLFRLPRMLVSAVNRARDKTYYPELPRKGFVQRAWDNIKWTVRYLDVNGYYCSYGLDIKNFRNQNDYMSFREFKLQREGAHYLYPEKYRFESKILLRDKYIFSCYLAAALGERYVPVLYGQIINGQVELYKENKMVSLEEYFTQDRRLICKKIDGECADGVMLLEMKNGVLRNGQKEITIEQLRQDTQNSRMLLQAVLEQHEKVNAINPHCINTIRIITIRGNSGVVNVLAASMRVGTRSDTFVDNRAVGGAAVGIDEKGRLKKYGFQHTQYGTKISEHPVTHFVFEGYQLPDWDEVVDLVIQAHKKIINVQSIGWDVALTPEGPVLIEGNDNWEIANPQDAHGGLKKRWYELVNQ